MMKRYAYLLTIAIFAGIFFTACDEDDPIIGGGDDITITDIKVNGMDKDYGMMGDTITIEGALFGLNEGVVSLVNDDTSDSPETIIPLEWMDGEITFIIPDGNPDGKYTITVTNDVSNESIAQDFYITSGPMMVEGVVAIPTSSTSVKVWWPAGPQDDWAIFDSYYVSDGQTGSAAIEVTNTDENSYEFTGLTEGQVYTFSVYAQFNDEEVSDPAEVMSSPATRFDNMGGEDIIIFTSSTTEGGSGLDLYDAVTDGPKVLEVVNGAQWNVGFEDKTSGVLKFGSASELEYNIQPQASAEMMMDPAGSNTVAYAEVMDLNDPNGVWGNLELGMTYMPSFLDLETVVTDSEGVVVACRVPAGNSYNYARVFIKRNSEQNSWTFNSEDGAGTYIWVTVSYQKAAGTPYAGQ
ncbi:MAG: hypothetical protein Kapaf2KO_15070 [Candidatus Kapaibacteriales bacterium]